MKKIAIIGGGLAGLTASIQLVRAGNACTVYEKKSYPLHRVCGEYLSNEALPFLTSSGLLPDDVSLPHISSLVLSSVTGNTCKLILDLGGFGVSRYRLDNHLYQIAQREGVDFCLNTEVLAVHFEDDAFQLFGSFGTHTADVVIAAHGKRSRLDKQLDRSFIRQRSPWVGVKYHVLSNQSSDTIALHNFRGGYCGVCPVENGVTNLCYLTHRDSIRRYGNLKQLESAVLYRNPHLERIFTESTFLFDRAEVINEVSFAEKQPVEHHILMAGDAAGMIAPLCGNGMAMAIHTGKLSGEIVNEYCAGRCIRSEMESAYYRAWVKHFQQRLLLGRQVQHMFGSTLLSSLLVNAARSSKKLAAKIIRQTHGLPF